MDLNTANAAHQQEHGHPPLIIDRAYVRQGINVRLAQAGESDYVNIRFACGTSRLVDPKGLQWIPEIEQHDAEQTSADDEEPAGPAESEGVELEAGGDDEPEESRAPFERRARVTKSTVAQAFGGDDAQGGD
jgi:hypothetical protein